MMEIIDDQNAQFMLLAGFIIAIGLVITTIILNSIIFEINSASGAGSDPSKDDIVNLMQITKNEIRSAYTTANKTDGTIVNRITNFSKQMNTFNGNLSKLYALHGEAVNVSWDLSNWNGFSYANFTESGTSDGVANWTVVEGVDASSVDIFKFWNIIIFSGKSFKIEARNSTGHAIWSIELNDTGYNIVNITSTSYNTFNLSNGYDLTSAQYYFKQSVSSNPVSINIVNGSNAYGRFYIHGTANGRAFYRERDYIFNATVTFSTSRVRSNITIPVSVPW